MQIRVLLVNEQPMLCKGVQALLEPIDDIEVIGEVYRGTDALVQVRVLQPEVTMLACTLPDTHGAEIAEEIKRSGLRTSILVYSRLDTDEEVKRMLRAGALGYALTTDPPPLLVEALRKVARGKLYLSPRVFELAAARVDRELRERPPQLTPREQEILRLVATGLPNAEIAKMLSLEKQSVKNVVRRIYQKLGVQSRPQAILRAIRLGLARGN